MLIFSCSNPLAEKYQNDSFDQDIKEMVESTVITKDQAMQIRCTSMLSEILEKDLSSKSYEQILSSLNDTLDEVSFISMAGRYEKNKLQNALTGSLFKVERRPKKGSVYYGFSLSNEKEVNVKAYAGKITISDLFGKEIYSGGFENDRKKIRSKGKRELWIKADNSNSNISLALKKPECEFVWDTQVVVYEDGTSLRFDAPVPEVSPEYKEELKSMCK
jgi:hypothetical protein